MSANAEFNKFDSSTLQRLAREAGAAKFYPEQQQVIEQNYIVGMGFLARFAELVKIEFLERARQYLTNDASREACIAKAVAAAPAAVPAAPAAAAVVSEADIAVAREYIADVHNATQMRSALSHLSRDVVIELAARGFVPSFYAAVTPSQAAAKGEA